MKKNYSKRGKHEYTWWRALIMHSINIFLFYPYFKIFYKVKIEGRENIPQDESFIVAASHSSYLDPPIVSMAINRPIAFMAKSRLFKNKFLANLIHLLGAFSVNQEKLEISTIRTAKAVISTKKWIMAMFPQGGRDNPNKITKVHPGFAFLAKSTKAKILPVSIVGSHEYHFIPFKGNLTVKIGKPMNIPNDIEQTMQDWCCTISELGEIDYKFNEYLSKNTQ